MVVLGIALGGEPTSIPLIVLGSGMFFVGMVMPALTEFEVGPTGFSAKLRERSVDFLASLGPEADQLIRTGTWLAGGPEAGRDLAERALIETYLRWPPGSVDLATAVRERMVELAPPAMPQPAPSPQGQPGDPNDLLGKLIALPVAERAALVLHLLEGLDTQSVATITGAAPAAVADDVARGAASIAGSTWPTYGAAG
ncbi:MAG TPA: hypothetical protein VF245_09855 [Solirubrobacterales bacterium]